MDSYKDAPITASWVQGCDAFATVRPELADIQTNMIAYLISFGIKVAKLHPEWAVNIVNSIEGEMVRARPGSGPKSESIVALFYDLINASIEYTNEQTAEESD